MKKNSENFIDSTNIDKAGKTLQLSDQLAMERTSLANERTLFAYIRTSLYLFISGLTLLELKSIEVFNVNYIAYICLIICGILLIVGIFRYRHLKKKLNEIFLKTKHEI